MTVDDTIDCHETEQACEIAAQTEFVVQPMPDQTLSNCNTFTNDDYVIVQQQDSDSTTAAPTGLDNDIDNNDPTPGQSASNLDTFVNQDDRVDAQEIPQHAAPIGPNDPPEDQEEEEEESGDTDGSGDDEGSGSSDEEE